MTKVKSGYYTQFAGNGYRLARENGAYFLISEDFCDVNNGFRILKNPYSSVKLFERKIAPDEISEVYSYSAYWIYKDQYRIMTYSDEEWFNDQPTCRIIANDYALAQKEGFETFMGQGEYIGTVKKSDLELIEVKKLANDFVR